MKKTLILAMILLFPLAALAAGNPKVVFETSKGKMVIELYPDKAPITVLNFLKYVDEKFYDGTVFHRVIPGFVIQGGGMTKDMTEKKTHDPIKNEADNGLANLRGTLSMARTMEVDSASSQFFINLVDNDRLDHKGKQSGSTWGYAVFGKVIEGMEAVDAIAETQTGKVGNFQDVPKEAISILKSYRAK